MYQTLFTIAVVFAVLAVVFLIATIAMFFGFNIPALRKDMSGSLEKKQIEEIRKNSTEQNKQRGKVNVFEELEKKAKPKKANTHSLNVGPTTGFGKKSGADEGTSVLNNNVRAANPNFVIDKNIMYVSTNEVI